MIHVAGTVSPFRGSVAGGDEQFLESGGPRDSEPAISSGRSRALSDVVLPAQATSAGTAWPRRRRLKQKEKKKTPKTPTRTEGETLFSLCALRAFYNTRPIPRASLLNSFSAFEVVSCIRRKSSLSESSSTAETEILCSERRYPLTSPTDQNTIRSSEVKKKKKSSARQNDF